MKRVRDTHVEVIQSPWDVVNGCVYTRGATNWRGLYTTYVRDHLEALHFKARWKRRCRMSLEMWPPSSGITSRGWLDSSTSTWVAPPFWWSIDCPHAECKPDHLTRDPPRTDLMKVSPTSPLLSRARAHTVLEPLALDIETVRLCESTFDSLYQSWRAYHTEPLVDGIAMFKHYWSLDDNGAYLQWWQEWSGTRVEWLK